MYVEGYVLGKNPRWQMSDQFCILSDQNTGMEGLPSKQEKLLPALLFTDVRRC